MKNKVGWIKYKDRRIENTVDWTKKKGTWMKNKDICMHKWK